MKRKVAASLLLPALLMVGCLEVDQRPQWVDGAYRGKPDQLPQQALYNGSRLSWNAAVTDRTHLQNEYLRAP